MKFLGDEYAAEYDDANWVVLPVPGFEYTTTFGRGTRYGPQAIINASQHIEPRTPRVTFGKSNWDGVITKMTELSEHVKIHTDQGLGTDYLFGGPDFSGKKAQMQHLTKVYAQVTEHLIAGKRVMTLGGEHSLSYAPLQAYCDHYKWRLEDATVYDSPFVVIQIDAHTDLYKAYNGEPHSHASIAHNLITDLKIPVVQIGVRSFNEDFVYSDWGEKLAIFPAGAFSLHLFLSSLWGHQSANERKDVRFYISLDVDGFDPSIIRSTGTPEPNGLMWKDFYDILRACKQYGKIIGGDVCELIGNPEIHKSDAADCMAAATAAYHIMAASEVYVPQGHLKYMTPDMVRKKDAENADV